MNAIIIHGTCDKEEYFSDKYPSLSNSHWFPWLQKQLLMKGIFTQSPEMPDAYEPDYDKWKIEFERYDVNEKTILIGHSCGGGFLLRWLSQNNIYPLKLLLVAPWIDPEREKTDNFFDFIIDKNLLEKTKLKIFISRDDSSDIIESVKIIRDNLPGICVEEFSDKGHFTFNDLKTTEFPEILSAILNDN